jgi:hypothetical protein
MVKKILATVLLAIGAVFVAPFAANAAPYVPDSNVSVSGSAVPGGTVNVNFAAGSFAPNETVHFTVSGEGTVTLAVFKAATVSHDKTANADGAVSLAVTLPSDARGTYTVTGTGATSGATATASFSVSPADTGAGSGTSASGSGLADTGSTVSVLVLWVAGGLVVLGAAFIAVRTVVRRSASTKA